MRPSPPRLAASLIPVLCLLATLFSFDGLASAQAATGQKRKLSQQSQSSPNLPSAASVKAAKVPPLTGDTWTGTAGDNNWGTAGNWSNGVPASTSAVTIGTATTNVNMNVNGGAFGTLTLSGSGDDLTVVNGVALDAYGNITNNGAINMNSIGNATELVLEGNVVLSGTGTLTLSNNAQNYIFGASAIDQLTNQETIQGAGQIGHGQMALVNSGTIDANQSAGMTIDANDGLTNTGTLEATAGSTLVLSNTGTVINTGGTISANGSTIQVNGSAIKGGAVTLTGASTLQLTNAAISGGTLTNSATGTIEIAAGTNYLGGTINNSAGGTFKIDNGAVLDLRPGTYAQLGTLQLNSAGNVTELVLLGNVTLSGGGVTLSNNAQNYIFGAVSADTLTNAETIQGAGQIGHGQMTLVNSGTINANQSAGITIAANGGITNTGTLEATGGATLALSSTGNIVNTGGTIAANAGTVQVTNSSVSGGAVTLTGASTLQLNNGTIHGGSTLTNSATGTIEIVAGTNDLGGTINNSAGGTFKIDNGAVLDLEGGTYAQLGTVQLNSVGNATELVLAGNVTLSGGTVTMSNNAQNYIFGGVSTDVLTNAETIQGAGQIGHGQLTLVNSGTINANQSAGITIQANGGVTNTGTLEATSGATLALSSTGNVINTGGTIAANTGIVQVTNSTVTGGAVTLTGASTLQLSNGTIQGGTLTNSATGTIEIVSGTNLLGGTISNPTGGILKIDNGAVLDLQGGTYATLGAVQLNSIGNATELVLNGNVTLSAGTVTLSNNVQNYIFGGVAADTLTNKETIQGAGQIGHGQMTLVNSGTINANQSAGMTIQASGGVTNTGTLEATSGATLALSSTGTVTNTGGKILANTGTLQMTNSTVNGGAITLTGASSLQLSNGNIQGGTLTNSATGTIEIVSGTNTLGGTISNAAGGILKVDNGAVLDLQGGTYAHLGAVQLNSIGNVTELVLQDNVTLSGGTVTLSNNAQNYIFGQTSTNTLTNQETIQGAGHIGNGQLTLVNSGTINSNGSAGMTIQANGGVTNTGTLEVTAGSTLALSSTGNVVNTAGTIAANTGTLQVTNSTVIGGAITLTGASTLQLSNGTIHGASTLTNSAAGTIEIASGTNTLGGTINNSAGGILKVDNGAVLDLDAGTYAQLGAVQLNSVGNVTELVLNGDVTLSGGTVTLSANAQNYIFGGSPNDVLTNADTIQGAGNIGNASMGLVNSGTILANASGNLVIDVSNQLFTNTGTVEADGATLTIEGPGVTFFTNDNQSTATLTGGTYIADGSNIQWNAGPNGITTLAAKVTEEGGGQLINTYNSLNANALAGLTTITATGGLTIGGVAFTDAGAFSNAGSLTLLPGESFTIGSLTQSSGGSLTAGTFVLDANLNISGTAQTITTNAATLTLAGGTIENTSNSTNALAGLATNTGKLTIGGASNNVSTTAASFSNTGTLTINAGDSFTAAKLTQITGTTLGAGTFVLAGNLDLTTAGISVTKNSATLTLEGGTINSNGVNALAALASNTKSLTIAGSGTSVSTSAATFANSGTVAVQAGTTFTAGGASGAYSQTAGTTTVDGTLASTSIKATGGSILGAGTLKGNTSIGNATGTAATLNVGDSGVAGLLAITGTYTQLATGTMNVSIGGLTTGTYSALSVSGNASLGGTLTAAIVNSLVLTASNIGQTFTILTSGGSVSGTFTNSTVTSGTDVFSVSYTSNSVVLTLTSVTGAGAKGSKGEPAAALQTAVLAAPKPITVAAKSPALTSDARHRVGITNRIARPILVAGLAQPGDRPDANAARGSELGNLRSWEHVPASPIASRPIAVARIATLGGVEALHSTLHNNLARNVWAGADSAIAVHPIATPSTLACWAGNSNKARVPVKIALPSLPRAMR
jgi:fibronectin-binding autotransporter adhesin